MTRRDLTPGQQIAQVAHATTEFAAHNRSAFSYWHTNSQFIIVLAVKDQQELSQLANKLENNDCLVESFKEPDLGNQLTAIAISPKDYEKAKPILSNIPLALPPKKVLDEIVVHYNKAHNITYNFKIQVVQFFNY